jgi:hypothetical protein
MRLPQDALSKTGLSNATATAPEAGEDVTLSLSCGPITVSLGEQEPLGAWILTVVTPTNRRCQARVRPTAAHHGDDRRSDRSLPSSAADAIDGSGLGMDGARHRRLPPTSDQAPLSAGVRLEVDTICLLVMIRSAPGRR